MNGRGPTIGLFSESLRRAIDRADREAAGNRRLLSIEQRSGQRALDLRDRWAPPLIMDDYGEPT